MSGTTQCKHPVLARRAAPSRAVIPLFAAFALAVAAAQTAAQCVSDLRQEMRALDVLSATIVAASFPEPAVATAARDSANDADSSSSTTLVKADPYAAALKLIGQD